MKITILADNTVAARNARGEHGLAFSIESGENCLLFDTGQGLVLADNAHALNVDLDAVDTIVLSHGHYDHTGGLAEILRVTAGPVAVHAHPDAILPKYQQGEAGVRDIGMPAQSQEAVRGGRCQFAASRQSAEVAPGIRTTGEIPRLHPEEAIAEPFCRDPEGRETDPLLDDQALFMGTAEGTAVLLGCAHSGIINTLDYIQSLTDGKPIRAVLGGMHLRSATEERMGWTIRELRRFNINTLVPMHCTGQRAAATLWAAFPHVCQAGGAGTVFEF
jgi:7,8-dihydropterin-6-yl-methyl-4-(beta-D-ribofuranosyl)aminobenzene 5'-phosphate synthase